MVHFGISWDIDTSCLLAYARKYNFEVLNFCISSWDIDIENIILQVQESYVSESAL